MYIKNSEYLSEYTGSEIDAAIEHMQSIEIELESKVDKTQTINGHSLEDNIELNAQDVGAASLNDIGNGTIVFTQGDIPQGTITANQTTNTTIALDAPGDGVITFTQGGEVKGTITANQTTNTTIALELGGGGGGSSSLSGLSDVDVANLEDGQALIYSSEDQKWKNGVASSVTFVDWTT